MSGEQATLSSGGSGVLRASRSKSYGSFVRSSLSPIRQRRIEHKLQPGETLQGLALKYGVSMEQIKRVNRLYTNESIFLKSSLLIPVPADLDEGDNVNSNCSSAPSPHITSSLEEKQEDGEGMLPDLTPVDFLKRLDDLISQSKQAAVKGCQDAEKRVAALEAACNSRSSAWQPLRRSKSEISTSRMQQQEALGAIPLTITKLTKNLREQEDEIFEL